MWCPYIHFFFVFLLLGSFVFYLLHIHFLSLCWCSGVAQWWVWRIVVDDSVADQQSSQWNFLLWRKVGFYSRFLPTSLRRPPRRWGIVFGSLCSLFVKIDGLWFLNHGIKFFLAKFWITIHKGHQIIQLNSPSGSKVRCFLYSNFSYCIRVTTESHWEEGWAFTKSR